METAPRALAYARTLVRNTVDAEDIVHNCYCRLLAKADEYNLPSSGTKLLLKAVTNACINWVQRRAPEVSWGAEVDGMSGIVSTARKGGGFPITDKPEREPVHSAMCNELQDAIDAALALLPVTQRAVVELRSLGHSLEEIAEMLGMTHANARVVLHRARQVLAKRLRPHVEDLEENAATDRKPYLAKEDT